MVIMNNTQIRISDDNSYYNDITKYFSKVVDEEVKPLYEIDEDNREVIIDRGLRFLLPKSIVNEIEDYSTHDIDIDVNTDPEFYRNILDGITLRDDQIMTVMKCLHHKRGLCQMSTGSGKTICIAAILKYYYLMLGYYPPTIIFEPTNYLVDDMIERFNSYGVPATKYADHRKKVEGVTISHPMSLYNDLECSDIFDEVKILIGDEFHHSQCHTWRSVHHNLSGLEVSLGFSASLINSSKLPIVDILNLEYDEAIIVGCTGTILVDFPTSFYIKNGILATPVVFRMHNLANEWVVNDTNWHLLRKFRLESDKRNKIVCDVSSLFNSLNFKILIVTGTKVHAEKLIRMFDKYHIKDQCVLSYGGGVYLKLNDNDELIDCRDENPKDKFDKGELNILIATTHLLEGADVPNLDVVILPEIGKKDRRIIQGIGRAMRRTKHGRYAYIVDFNDIMSGVLYHQSNLRMNLYKEVIGVDPNNIFDNCHLDQMKQIVKILEKL